MLALAAIGCAQTVKVQTFPGLEQAQAGVSAVAVAPFEARGRDGGVLTEGPEASGAPVVARQVAEAIAAHGVSVIPPEDVQTLLDMGAAAVFPPGTIIPPGCPTVLIGP